MANSCGRAARGNDVGRERFAVLCRMLLMVFQRARGLDDPPHLNLELKCGQMRSNDFLAAAINLW